MDVLCLVPAVLSVLNSFAIISEKERAGFFNNCRPVYIESRVCVVKEAVMCIFEY